MSRSHEEEGYRPPVPDKKMLADQLARKAKKQRRQFTQNQPDNLDEDRAIEQKPVSLTRDASPLYIPVTPPETAGKDTEPPPPKKKIHARSYGPPRYTRRVAVAGTAVGIGLLVLAGYKAQEQRSPSEAEPGKPPQANEVPSSKNKEIVTNFAKRLGFSYSEPEQELWKNMGYDFSSSRNFPTPELRNRESRRRFGSKMIGMASSENQRYQKAAQTFIENFQDIEYQVRYNPKSLESGVKETLASIGVVIGRDGNVQPMLTLSESFLLDYSDGQTGATVIAHEMDHVRKLVARLQETAGLLTPQQQIDRERELAQNPDARLDEEVRASTIEVLSYIEAVGRGYPGTLSDQEAKAAAFILAGGQTTSIQWREAVKNYWTLD